MNGLKLDSLSIEKQEALQAKRLDVVLDYKATAKERVIALDKLRKVNTGEGILAEGEHPDVLCGSPVALDWVTPVRMNELMMEVVELCEEYGICSTCGEDLCGCTHCGASLCECSTLTLTPFR